MTSRTPAFSDGGAGLMDGFDERRWRQMREGQPRGRNLGQRSPKERSAVPGVSQRRRHSSSQRRGGGDPTASAQGGGPAPASKTTTGIGTSRRPHLGLGLVVLCPDNNPLHPATYKLQSNSKDTTA